MNTDEMPILGCFFAGRKRSASPAADQSVNKSHDSGASLKALCEQKGISYAAYDAVVEQDAEFSQHVDWVYKNILKHPYPDDVCDSDSESDSENDFPRYYHGILHASRVALLCKVFVKLYADFGNQKAVLLLQPKLLSVMKIAGLFHDTGREDDGDDKWEHESAMLCYFYLTKVCKYPEQLARGFSEAVANKDYQPGQRYLSLQVNGETWQWSQGIGTKSRSILQCILHDADCLDILRCRDMFDHNYLYCMRVFAQTPNAEKNEWAESKIFRLIEEQKSLIKEQGDLLNFNLDDAAVERDFEKKVQYEKSQCYELIKRDITAGDYPLLAELAELTPVPRHQFQM